VTGGYLDSTDFSGVFMPTGVARTTRLFDQDHDGFPELATFHSTASGQVGYASGNPQTDTYRFDMYTLDPPITTVDDVNNDIWLGDLVGDAGDELLVLDDIMDGASRVHMAADLAIDTTTIGAASGLNDQGPLSAPDPRRIIAGDFDGDGQREIRVFGPSLDADNTRCLQPMRLPVPEYDFPDCP
jgi:hypothetical protein